MTALIASRSDEIWEVLEAESIGALLPVSALIEWTATKNSAFIFIYDSTENFGLLTKEWHQAGHSATPVVCLQTRSGAGSSIIGEILTRHKDNASVISAYTSPEGLLSMIQTISYIPPSTSAARFVIQVPAVGTTGSTTALAPSTAPLLAAVNFLSTNFAIILSSSPQEASQLARLSYQVSDLHVIHVFDQYGSAREFQDGSHHLNKQTDHAISFEDALLHNGIQAFDYTGDPEAEVVIVLLNGTYACLAKAFATQSKNFGVVSVRVLRPWDGEAFQIGRAHV